MPELAVLYLGDIVGSGGRAAAARAAAEFRARFPGGAVIANGENSRNGSGLSPDNLRELRRGGIDAVTLGDHCYKDRAITGVLDDEAEPVCRPANLSAAAPGKRIVRVVPRGSTPADAPPLFVFSVLGRLFMPMPADSPFDAIDRELGALGNAGVRGAMVIVEVHAEATSEKQALAWHCLQRWTGRAAGDGPRIVAVVGSHTHVQTADARILDHTLAAITDLGMTGPHRSVIGRSIADTLAAMTTQSPTALSVAEGDNRAKGVILRLDTDDRRAIGIEAFDLSVPE